MGWKITFHANGNDKEVELAILISDKIDFNPKKYNKRQRRALYNDKEISTRREYHTR